MINKAKILYPKAKKPNEFEKTSLVTVRGIRLKNKIIGKSRKSRTGKNDHRFDATKDNIISIIAFETIVSKKEKIKLKNNGQLIIAKKLTLLTIEQMIKTSINISEETNSYVNVKAEYNNKNPCFLYPSRAILL